MSEERSSRPVWLGEDQRGWDHIRVHRQIILDSRMEAFHQAVYNGLALHAETRSGDCYPAETTLAIYAGCSERTVRDVLREMAGWKYIEIIRRPGKASIYRLLPPPELPKENIPTPRQEVPGSKSDTPAGGSGVPRQEVPTNENQLTRYNPLTPLEGEEKNSDMEIPKPKTPLPPSPAVPQPVASWPSSTFARDSVDCPRCHAKVGDACRTSSGKGRLSNHKERAEAALPVYEIYLSRKPSGPTARPECETCDGMGVTIRDDGLAEKCTECCK